MIFVTVGTHTQGFGRLIKAMDEIASRTDEKIIMQIGHTKYKPKNCDSFDFASRSKMEELNRQARVVVAHAGEGSIITALRYAKPTIIVPRLRKFGEHINDHQLELAKKLDEEGKVVMVSNTKDLEKTILTVTELALEKPEKPMMIEMIKRYLNKLDRQTQHI